MERVRIDLTKHLDKTALIYYRPNKTSDEVKYKDLLRQTLKVGLALEGANLLRTESIAIGILCKKDPSAISLLLAIMEADFAFCFLTKADVPNELNKLGIKYFFSDEPIDHGNLISLRNSLEVFGRKIYLYQSSSSEAIRIYKDLGDSMNRICYVITTSGTTGQRKIVRPTYNCITSNVIALQKIFHLDKDVIYSSAPCTFDVFVLDLFLSLHSGSALMIVDESLRYSDESINFMFATESTGVTFLQITPSLFQQYGLKSIKETIMHQDSSLKYLVLGGETFPSTKEVITWQDWNSSNRKRVFNIYGTTEVSCWAMIHEVTKEDLDYGIVPLGELLDDTAHAFSPDLSSSTGLEEIVLTSQTRICFVDDKGWDQALGQGHHFAQHTNDLVKRINDKIYYFGRQNEIIKKFGERVNLNLIESAASVLVPNVACVYTKKKIILFAKTDDDHLIEEIGSHLKMKLKPFEVPDDIRKISFFPLSDNGKISKQQLKEIYKDFMKEDRDRRLEAEESFLEAINQILNLRLGKASSPSDEPDGKRMRTEIDQTFKSLGGTSFDALRISMKLEDQTGLSNGLLPKLLSDRHSIRDICHYLKDFKPQNTQVVESQRAATSSIITEIVQRFNLEKCIDSSPAIVVSNDQHLVSVGSHSHKLITIDAKTLKIVSETELGDRIESEVTAFHDSGLVGCYDGHLYSFNLQSGDIQWKFDSKGMIKSKALVVDDCVIFGNYNYEQNLWCLQRSDSGEMNLKWSKMIGSRGILAAPLLVNDTSLLICTLDGTLEMLNVTSGESVWSKKFESPIFSSPKQILSREEFLIAEVSKQVHCIDFNGNILWNYRADGHIFSSFLFNQNSDDEISIMFGCHDKKLRCLSYDFQHKSVNLTWSTELQSQIYGTPRLVTINSEDFVVSCATSGFINFVKFSNGKIEHVLKLTGEIFSTPLIYERKLFVGCRDNLLYVIQF